MVVKGERAETLCCTEYDHVNTSGVEANKFSRMECKNALSPSPDRRPPKNSPDIIEGEHSSNSFDCGIAGSRYWLDRDGAETARLNEQHEYLKRVLGRSVPLPDVLRRELEEVVCCSEEEAGGGDDSLAEDEYAILDIGAGTLAWTLDIAKAYGVDSEGIFDRESTAYTPIDCDENGYKSDDEKYKKGRRDRKSVV